MFPRFSRKPKTVARTKDARRAQLVQILTLRSDLTSITAADIARWTGLSEPECFDALQRELARRVA